MPVSYYQANNSVNVYKFINVRPKKKVWYWVKNISTDVTTVVSGTDVVAKWTIHLKQVGKPIVYSNH